MYLFEDVFFNPVLVDTLVDTVDALLKLGRSGVYNVVSDVKVSKYDFG